MVLDDDARIFALARRLARLATVDPAGAPHAVPICFALDGDTLYTPVDEKPKRGGPRALRRLRNIAADPRAQVLFDVYDDADWSRLRYLQLRGRGRTVEDPAERRRAISLLRGRYPQYREMDLEARPLIAVDITHAVDWRAS